MARSELSRCPASVRSTSPTTLTVGPDGAVYLAYNVAGKVLRVDPVAGTSCEIASGLTLTSAVKFGAGPGWDSRALYAVGFDGAVRKLTPPVG